MDLMESKKTLQNYLLTLWLSVKNYKLLYIDTATTDEIIKPHKDNGLILLK